MEVELSLGKKAKITNKFIAYMYKIKNGLSLGVFNLFV